MGWSGGVTPFPHTPPGWIFSMLLYIFPQKIIVDISLYAIVYLENTSNVTLISSGTSL